MLPDRLFRALGLTRRTAILAASLAAIGMLAVYWAWDPAAGSLFPKCAFKAITGWDCPGCGSQRALHAMLHGRMAEAWHANPYFLIAVPAASMLGWVEFTREQHPALYRSIYRPATFIIILFLTIGWWIFRNL